MTQTVKAKRELKNIDFSKETSHIALVGPLIGGPANGADYALVMKSLNGVSTDFVQKMQAVKVTLETPEFLRKFFGLYYEDAEVLARLMGYVDEDDEKEDTEEWSYENYIQEKLDSFEIVKSTDSFKDTVDLFKALGEEKFLELLNFQAKTESSVIALDKLIHKSTKVDNSTKAVTSTEDTHVENENVEANASVKLEKSMETIEKSVHDGVLVELAKAQETIAAFKVEKQAAIAKSRKDTLVSVVKDQTKAETLFKSLEQVSDEQFDATVTTLKEMFAIVEKSALFEEKGAAVDTAEPVKESGVMKALKAQKFVK